MCLRFWNPWAIGTNKKYRKGAPAGKLRQLKYAVPVSACSTIRAAVPKTASLSSHKSLFLREK